MLDLKEIARLRTAEVSILTIDGESDLPVGVWNEVLDAAEAWLLVEREREAAMKQWRLLGFLPTTLELYQAAAPPRDKLVAVVDAQPNQALRAAVLAVLRPKGKADAERDRHS